LSDVTDAQTIHPLELEAHLATILQDLRILGEMRTSASREVWLYTAQPIIGRLAYLIAFVSRMYEGERHDNLVAFMAAVSDVSPPAEGETGGSDLEWSTVASAYDRVLTDFAAEAKPWQRAALDAVPLATAGDDD
jgi:hypothetical protein